VAGVFFQGADQGTAVQQTDTSIEDRRGRLIAELERKLEQLKKDVVARDGRIAELQFQLERTRTLLFEALDNNARRALP
jgi:TolA-binding protein